MIRWLLPLALTLAGCAAPLYVCYPTTLARQSGQAKGEILVCFPHDRDELTLKAMQDEANALEMK